jgi:hypothetical protein
MFPASGFFATLLVAITVIIALAWVFAPHAWALGITIVLVIAFVCFVAYVLSNTRFT